MERIGWENNQGAYFINKLDERMTASEQSIETLNSVSSKSYSLAGGGSLTFNKPDGITVMYVMRDATSIYEMFVIDIWGGIKHLIGTSEAITVSISNGVVTVANSSAYAVAVLVQCGVHTE